MFLEAVGTEGLDGNQDAGMERAAALPEQAAVGDLVRERVLERVLWVGEQARLVNELSRLEATKALME